jgi:quinone-modifying oxidoreductase subunit QmoC
MQAPPETILFEGDCDTKFLDEVAALPEGERVRSCIQCGTCGGTCPVGFAMDATPRRIFAMVRAGMKKEVLESSTPWICASCYKCTVNCPAEIRITEIMYALKRMGIAEKVVPGDPGPEKFIKIFTEMVTRFGRGYELGLMLKFMLPGKAIELIKQAPIGMAMLMEGRMPLLPHRIADLEGFKKMVARAIELEEGKA